MPKRKSTFEKAEVTLTLRITVKQEKALRKEARERNMHLGALLRDVLDGRYKK